MSNKGNLSNIRYVEGANLSLIVKHYTTQNTIQEVTTRLVYRGHFLDSQTGEIEKLIVFKQMCKLVNYYYTPIV